MTALATAPRSGGKAGFVAGAPESSVIDRAVAASVAAFFSVDFDAEGQPADIDMIVDGAERILLSKGFDWVRSPQ